jgi:hypothetical protein
VWFRDAFRVQGKSGIQHAVSVTDKRIARIVQHVRARRKSCSYLDEGKRQEVDAEDVNSTSESDATSPPGFPPGPGRCWPQAFERRVRRTPEEAEAKRHRRCRPRPSDSATPAASAASTIYIRPYQAYLEGSVLPAAGASGTTASRKVNPASAGDGRLAFLKGGLNPITPLRKAQPQASPQDHLR